RTDVLTATRTERATYMLERPGAYALPAVEIAWWNLRDEKVAEAHVDAVTLQVSANPAALGGESSARAASRWRAVLSTLAADWPPVVLALGALAVLAWMFRHLLRGASEQLERRRSAYRHSEGAAFARLRKTARQRDAEKTYFALLAWLERFTPVAPDHTIA